MRCILHLGQPARYPRAQGKNTLDLLEIYKRRVSRASRDTILLSLDFPQLLVSGRDALSLERFCFFMATGCTY